MPVKKQPERYHVFGSDPVSQDTVNKLAGAIGEEECRTHGSKIASCKVRLGDHLGHDGAEDAPSGVA